MTFWQDARPASSRFRMPRSPRSTRRWSRRRRRALLVLVAVVIAAVGVSMVRADGEATAETSHPAHDRDRRTRASVIPARWKRTLPDWPALTVTTPGGGAIVVGDHHVYSVVLADGTLRWQTALDDVDRSAAVAGDTVLVSRDSGFAALERATGRIRWRTDTTETPSSVALVGPAGAAQVAVVSTLEGGFVGIDSHTGRPRWSVRFSGSPVGIFAVDEGSGTLATVWEQGKTGSQLRVIDGATGTLRWEQPIAVMPGSAVVSEGIVVVGSGSVTNGGRGGEVRAFALADGAPRWRTHVGAPFQPDLVPLVDGDELFVVDQVGDVSRLGLADGVRRWARRTRALSVYTEPIRVDDAILISNEAGEVVTLDRRSGRIRARRRPAGLPVGLAATSRWVIVVQRLVRHDAIQAFDADRLVKTARSRP